MKSDSTVLPDRAREIEILIYPPLQGSGCGGGACSCGPDPMQVLLQRLNELAGKFGHRLHVELAQYTSNLQLQRAIDKLNLVLKASDSEYVVSDANLVAVLSTATPILIIDNVIVSSGSVPSREMLSKYLESIA